MIGKRPRLVVAEPDQFMRESICLGLGERFEISQASRGSEVMDLFAAETVDAVFSCAELSDGSAADLCAKLRRSPGGTYTPFYIYHFEDDGKKIAQAFEAGASDFLVHPVHLGILGIRMSRDIRIAERMYGMLAVSDERAQVDGEIFRQLPVAAILAGESDQVLQTNPAFERLFERRASVLGKPVAGLLGGLKAADFENEATVVAELNCQRRGQVPVNVSHCFIEEGPWRGCHIYFMRERPRLESGGLPRMLPISQRAGIIVLEDHDLVARSLRRLLEKAGHTVCLASSAEEATGKMAEAIAEKTPFDLAILDISIPGSLGGAEVLKALRMMAPSLLGIVTSGSWSEPAMNRPSEFGFNAALRKPFSRNELLAVTNKVLTGRAK